MPEDSLVYLESNDIGAVMKTITDRPAFRDAAKSVPDFSVLNGVKLAIAVTGFKTKEEPVTDQNAVLKFTPHFVAAIETNAWNFQAKSFTENQLGEFINHVYGGEVLLETSNKYDGSYYVWSSNDGRKAYALVQGSVILFSNDESSIEKALAVKRGETESISKNPKITDGDRLALGYVSPDGVAQIASILGVKYANDATEDTETKSALAGILPQLVRKTVTEITWTATRNEYGMVDHWVIGMPSEIANVFTESMSANSAPDLMFLDNLNESVPNVTLYNLKDPNIAWRSIVLNTQRQSDPIAARIIPLVAESVFEPYGIKDSKSFFDSVGKTLATAGVSDATDERVLIAPIKSDSVLRKALVSTLKRTEIGFGNGRIEIWKAESEDIAAYFENQTLILGATESVLKALSAGGELTGEPSRVNSLRNRIQQRISGADPPSALTLVIDLQTASKLADILGEVRSDEQKPQAYGYTENRFNNAGMERLTNSDFGFIGWIITQIADDND